MSTKTRINLIALLMIVVAVCALVVMAQCANGQPATQTATITLPSGTDLSTYRFAAGNHYVAANGKPTYQISRGLILANLPNVSIRLLGNKVTLGLPYGSGSGILLVNSPGCEIAGMDIIAAPTAATVVNVINSPHPNIHDLTAETQVEQMVQLDQGSDWAICSRIIAKKPTGSRLIYIVGTQHVTCLYCSNVGSLGEDGIRCSQWTATPPAGGHRNPRFILISHCTLTTIPLPNKQPATISLRNVGDGTPDDFAEVSDCDLGDWVRPGQATNVPTVFNLRFNRNICRLNPNGFVHLPLMAATLAQCDGNTFYVDDNQRAINWDHFSCQVCVPTNNTILKMDPATKAKPLMIEIRTFSEANGANTAVKVRPDYAPPPRTQPATRP